jgi:phosphotransferase system IIA component
VAPFSGVVSSILEAKHGCAIESELGFEVFVQFGSGFELLDGRGFVSCVETGSRVNTAVRCGCEK